MPCYIYLIHVASSQQATQILVNQASRNGLVFCLCQAIPWKNVCLSWNWVAEKLVNICKNLGFRTIPSNFLEQSTSNLAWASIWVMAKFFFIWIGPLLDSTKLTKIPYCAVSAITLEILTSGTANEWKSGRWTWPKVSDSNRIFFITANFLYHHRKTICLIDCVAMWINIFQCL